MEERRGIILTQAEEYAKYGFRVIPLRQGKKIPAPKAWQTKATDDIKTIESWVDTYGNRRDDLYGIGLVMGAFGMPGVKIFAIDIDAHDNGVCGWDFYGQWKNAHGNLPDTMCQMTPNAGMHLFYMLVPDPNGGMTITGGAHCHVGIDWRHDNQLVCAYPTSFNGKQYELGKLVTNADGLQSFVKTDQVEAIAPADDNVFAFVKAVEDEESRLARAEWCTTQQVIIPSHGGVSIQASDVKPIFEQAAPKGIKEGGRDDYLFRYATSLRGKGIYADNAEGQQKFIDAVLAENERACDPPVSVKQATDKAIQALKYENGHANASNDSADGNAANGNASNAVSVGGIMLETTNGGQVKRTLTNVVRVLEANDAISQNVVTNAFTGETWLLAPCIDEDEVLSGHVSGYPRVFSMDTDMPTVMMYCEKHGFSSGISSQVVKNAWAYFVNRPSRRYDPFKRVMQELGQRVQARRVADGEYEYSYDGGQTWRRESSAVGTVLPTLFDAPVNALTRAEERLLFRGIVARAAYKNEAKCDYAWVLRGEQGIGKSTFCELLSLDPDSMYTDVNKDLGDRDTQMLWAGKLVAELGEGTSMKKSDVPVVRDMITRRTDEYRRPYGHDVVRVPRTCLFVVTANESDLLTDTTGNRRWLIIECGRRKNDISPAFFDGSAKALIDKAFAETIADLRAERKHAFLSSLVLSKELSDAAERVNAAHMSAGQDVITVTDWANDRRAGGAYQDALRDYNAGRLQETPPTPEQWKKGDVITVTTALREALGMRSENGAKIRGAARRPLSQAIDNAPCWKRLDGAGNVKHTDVNGATSRERAWVYVGDDEDDGSDDSDRAFDDEMPYAGADADADTIDAAVDGFVHSSVVSDAAVVDGTFGPRTLDVMRHAGALVGGVSVMPDGSVGLRIDNTVDDMGEPFRTMTHQVFQLA